MYVRAGCSAPQVAEDVALAALSAEDERLRMCSEEIDSEDREERDDDLQVLRQSLSDPSVLTFVEIDTPGGPRHDQVALVLLEEDGIFFVQFGDHQIFKAEFKYFRFELMQSILEKQFAEIATKPEHNEKGWRWDQLRESKLRHIQEWCEHARKSAFCKIKKLPLEQPIDAGFI